MLDFLQKSSCFFNQIRQMSLFLKFLVVRPKNENKIGSPLFYLTNAITAYQYIPQYHLDNYCTRSNKVLKIF